MARGRRRSEVAVREGCEDLVEGEVDESGVVAGSRSKRSLSKGSWVRPYSGGF